MLKAMLLVIFIAGLTLLIVAVIALFRKLTSGGGTLKLPGIEVTGKGSVAFLFAGVLLMLAAAFGEQRLERAASEASLPTGPPKELAETRLAAAEAAIEDAKSGVEAAPKSKDTKADLALFEIDLEGLTLSLSSARDQLAKGFVAEVVAKARSVEAQARYIKQQLDEVLEQVAVRKKRHR